MVYGNTLIRIFALLIFIGIIAVSSCSDDGEPQVVENEDIFINEIYAAGDDWLELYNAANAAKNIGGYFIYDDVANKYTLPANTSIPGKGFLILTCDDTGVGLHTNFKLTSDGEAVHLENPAGRLIDKVEFPPLSDGQSYGRYPDGSANLVVSGNTSQSSPNGDDEAPAIQGTTRIPLVPLLTDIVTINAALISTTGVTSMKLFYRINGGTYTEATMTPNGSLYSSTIPAQNTTGKVEYYIEAKSSANKTTVDPFDAPSGTYSFLLNTDILPSLFVNEFMADNKACCPDTDGGNDEFDDWIEIYNGGVQPVDIGGMYLSDNKANPFKHKIPTDNPTVTTIPAGGFLLLWADGTKNQGSLHLDFSLANSGEDIGLYYIDGREINAYTFGMQAENNSFGRVTNGDNTWISFTTPTQGQSNN